MWRIIRGLADAGVTVFLTTQYLEEADLLADRIAVLDGGRVVADGTPAQLKSRVAEQRLDLTLADRAERSPPSPTSSATRPCAATRTGCCLGVATDGSAAAHPARCSTRSTRTGRRGRRPSRVHTATLDDVFLALTGHRHRHRTTQRRRPPVSDLALSRPAAARPSAAAPDRRRLTMIGRCLRLSRRNVEALLTSLMLPIMLMLLFVYLFGGAINTGGAYVTYVVPGVILLCAGFGSATTAVSVSQDMNGAIIDRFRSMDISGASVLSGQVAASVVRNVASTVLVFGVAFAIGFRPTRRPAGVARRGRRPGCCSSWPSRGWPR